MSHGVDDRFADRGGRQAPLVLSSYPADGGTVQRVLLDECDRFVDGLNQGHLQLGVVEDESLVRPVETAGLDPGVGKVGEAVPAAGQHAADRRYRSTLV